MHTLIPMPGLSPASLYCYVTKAEEDPGNEAGDVQSWNIVGEKTYWN